MAKSGRSILRGARQALAHAQGRFTGGVAHVPEEIDVVAIRRRLGLSQGEFATRFGFKLDAVQNWEQGRRRPVGAARALLRVIEREPEAVQRALVGSVRRQPSLKDWLLSPKARVDDLLAGGSRDLEITGVDLD